MSDPNTTPPPPPPAAAPPPPPQSPPPAYTPATPPTKEGMSTLAKVGIGCGILLLLALFVVLGLTCWGVKKAGDFIEEAERNPVTSMARIYAAAHPDIELVEADEGAGTATFRDTNTGETITVDAADIKEGRISFESAEGRVDIGRNEDGSQGATITQTDAEGNVTTSRYGVGSEIPEWVLTYPGAEIEGTFATQTGEGEQGAYSVKTSDSMEDVMAFYKEALEGEGFAITTNVYDAGSGRAMNLNATRENPKGNYTVVLGTEGGMTQGMVQYGRNN